MLSGTRANIAIKVFGDDLNRLYTIGNEIKSLISDVDGVADLNVEQQVERQQLQIVPKRNMLAKYGITMSEFGQMVRVMLEGEPVSVVYEGNKVFDLVLKANDESRATAEEIRRMPVNADGQMVPLGYIADVVSTVGPNTINRENVARKLVVSANVTGGNLTGVVEEIQRRIAGKVSLPEGYHIEYGGQFESEKSASQTLLVTSLMAIVVIFLLLFNQFRDLWQSTVVLLNLPLALIGGVVAISLTGGIVSIPAIIGFISLFGIATRNGMLLVSRYNDLAASGKTVEESVTKGSADRLIPILMTALTSALALIPLAVSGDLPGNEIQSPMAKVILGGLVTSTLLNAFVIPAVYSVKKKRF